MGEEPAPVRFGRRKPEIAAGIRQERPPAPIAKQIRTRLAPKEFIRRVQSLYKEIDPGSIFMTFKRFDGTYPVKKAGKKELKHVSGATPGLVVRITDGKRQTFTTFVPQQNHVGFEIELSKVMVKAHILTRDHRK